MNRGFGVQGPFRVRQMEIIREERTYEGIHAVPALVMGLMEVSGIRKMIDHSSMGLGIGCYDLSPGMAVKAMVGTMVERGKTPLYRVEDYYSTAPTDLLFGRDVDNGSLSDTILASRLDTIFRLDMREVQLKAYGLLKEMYGFDTDRLFMDATNYTMFGIRYLTRQTEFDMGLEEKGIIPKESPIPAYGGNAKDGHNDRVQLSLSHVVDRNGIPVVSSSYDGNTSDITMNKDMIEFLARELDMKRCILMADSKLCVKDVLNSLISSGTAFVTKVPVNFDGKVKDDVIYSVLHSTMDPSDTRPGRSVYETDHMIDGHRVRLIAYLLPKAKRDSLEFIRTNGLKRFNKAMKTLSFRTFFCESDAMDAFRHTMDSQDICCFRANAEVYIDDATAKRKGDGKRFRLRITDTGIDDGRLESAIAEHAVQVLITNLPFSSEHSEEPRFKASADDVIDLYLEQYKAEAGFKMMKSGMNIGNVYIHTPSRITAVAFIVSLATMLCTVANMVLRETKTKGEPKKTVKSLVDIHQNALVWYDRRKDRMSITGGPGDTEAIFDLADRLKIPPEYLLTH